MIMEKSKRRQQTQQFGKEAEMPYRDILSLLGFAFAPEGERARKQLREESE